jgi:heme O synthase-like polyprenyltransferase
MSDKLTDTTILAFTGVLSYLSMTMEDLNLYLAVCVKIGTLLTTLIYILLNRRRIWEALKCVNKKSKK